MTISTPRLDSLTADGTDHSFDGIRLADGNMLTLNVRPGAETAEVFLLPGLTAPDTEVWLTGGEFGDGSLYGGVPVEAVRELIVEHGGEHANQEPPTAPEETAESDTAEAVATRALAEWGITAHRDEESLIGGDRNTWLVIGHDQNRPGFPRMLAEPYVVLYLAADSEDDDEEITVTRAPADGDVWDVVRGDGTGAERTLMTRPVDQLAACVEAIADWLTAPQVANYARVDRPE
ncbi:hypothetical protein ACIPJN_36605 [Streptomyces sp. NPDC086796]|uniref:hypothetical protein n=1 Tax=Streptomyces sp. NPDC086796 TaxID=3365760 RepID=UPI00382E3316